MANLEHYLATLGPIAILLGGAFEGQTAVIAGGVMARQQVISPAMAVGMAALGSGLLDYALFVLGRSFRHTGFVRRVSAKPAFAKCLGLIERYPVGFILSFRFLYGLRAAGPVAVGVSQVTSTLFGVLNAVGAAIWAGVFVGLGYAFGPAVMTLLGAMVAHAAPIVIGLGIAAAVAGLGFWRWRVWVSQNA
jgi:membrane protein DedA with SNARE-associated domain